jgi:tetratricopeptide (TPR) repeat protein
LFIACNPLIESDRFRTRKAARLLCYSATKSVDNQAMAESFEELIERAYALRRAGNRAGAEATYASAAYLARSTGDSPSLAHALRHVSDLARERGAPAEGLAAAREAAEIYRSQGAKLLGLANSLRLQALALEALGRLGESRPLWEEAGALYRRADLAAAVAECDRHLGS